MTKNILKAVLLSTTLALTSVSAAEVETLTLRKDFVQTMLAKTVEAMGPEFKPTGKGADLQIVSSFSALAKTVKAQTATIAENATALDRATGELTTAKATLANLLESFGVESPEALTAMVAALKAKETKLTALEKSETTVATLIEQYAILMQDVFAVEFNTALAQLKAAAELDADADADAVNDFITATELKLAVTAALTTEGDLEAKVAALMLVEGAADALDVLNAPVAVDGADDREPTDEEKATRIADILGANEVKAEVRAAVAKFKAALPLAGFATEENAAHAAKVAENAAKVAELKASLVALGLTEAQLQERTLAALTDDEAESDEEGEGDE